MRHAFCITAYQDFLQVNDLIDRLAPHNLYIHIDARSALPEWLLQKCISQNVYILQKYKINWGSILHIYAVIDLLECAQRTGMHSCYHILSENTFPVWPMSDIENFFCNTEGNYFAPFHAANEDAWRYKFYHFFHIYNMRTLPGKIVDKVLVKLQKAFRVQRKLDFEYKTYLWCHLSEQFVHWGLNWLSNNACYVDKFKYCYVGEEYFFIDLIMRSPYKDTVIFQKTIYDDWSERPGGKPAFLDIGDYQAIIDANMPFARKIHSTVSAELVKKLLERHEK